jgi:hypothetical protein
MSYSLLDIAVVRTASDCWIPANGKAGFSDDGSNFEFDLNSLKHGEGDNIGMMFHLVFLTEEGDEVRDTYLPFECLEYASAFASLALNQSDLPVSVGAESRVSSFVIFDLDRKMLHRSSDIEHAPHGLPELEVDFGLSGLHCSEPDIISEQHHHEWSNQRQQSASIDRDLKTVTKVLCQAIDSYTGPVARLLIIRDAAVGQDPSKWLNYKSDFGIGIEHEADLIRLATDGVLRATSRKEHKAWGPIHATRALGQMRSSRAVPALLHALRENIESSPTPQEIGYVLAAVGDLAMEILSDFLVSLPEAADVEIAIVLAMGEVASFEPSLKQVCIENVRSILRSRTTISTEASIDESSVVCSFAVAILLQMKAASCYREILEAHRLGIVDCTFCGDIEDVEIRLGMRTERTSPRLEFGPLPTAEEIAQILCEKGIDLGPAFYHLRYSKP